jgi:hypothetical protein
LKTRKQNAQVFLVLVPHRDIRFILRKYSEELFKAGFSGAFYFPWVVPVALLSAPLSKDELKHCAISYREAAGKDKITAVQSAVVEYLDNTALFGPRLEPEIPVSIFNERAALKVKRRIVPSVIGSCLYDHPPLEPPQITFRAAAFANMYWKPLDCGAQGAQGNKWKTGELIWLPKKCKTCDTTN